MPTPSSDRSFMALFMDVDQWLSNRDGMVCLECASGKGVKQGARASGNRLPVWACSTCQARHKRLKGKR